MVMLVTFRLRKKRRSSNIKEEMESDGQDEPITSMPKKVPNDADHVYSPTDPIMNAPSC